MAEVASRIFQAGRGRLPLFLEFWPQAAQVFLSLATGLVVQGILDPEGADWARGAG